MWRTFGNRFDVLLVCLHSQSDVCLEAMGVEFESSVYPAAVANNILYVRVPVFDFDRIDQVGARDGG